MVVYCTLMLRKTDSTAEYSRQKAVQSAKVILSFLGLFTTNGLENTAHFKALHNELAPAFFIAALVLCWEIQRLDDIVDVSDPSAPQHESGKLDQLSGWEPLRLSNEVERNESLALVEQALENQLAELSFQIGLQRSIYLSLAF